MSSSSIISDTSEEDQLPPGVSAVLRHPSGVDVFIVGVAHYSEEVCASNSLFKIYVDSEHLAMWLWCSMQ